MAFMGIFFANILLVFICGTAFIAFVFFIISMILFSKNKKLQTEGKKVVKKTSAIVTLVISIIFFIPLVISIFVLSVSSIIEYKEERQTIDSFENKVIVKNDYEWKKGFEYNGKNLVPVNIFMNSYYYKNSGALKNLNKIGALVIKHTNNYYSFYELENDSGYKIYYVGIESFIGEEYYSRTFVDKKDLDSVLKYYNTSALQITALWKTAPQDTNLSTVWKSLKINLEDNRDEIMELSHEVLDNPNKKMSRNESKNYDECMSFQIESTDKVFVIDLDIYYTKDGKIYLDLNDYEVEDKLIKKYKDMLISLINDSQKELLQSMKEVQ